MDQTEAIIKSSLVINEQRMEFLPKHFGRAFLIGEQLLYKWAGVLSTEYHGGLWLFFELDNGGFYAAPEGDGKLYVQWHLNSYEGHLGAEAFGIVVTLYVLCFLAEKEGEKFAQAYHALRAFALQHPEWREIYRAID